MKDIDHQATLCLHRTRQGFVTERTAIYNRIRGLIAEFGLVLPQKVERLRREILPRLEDLPGWVNRCVGDVLSHADVIEARIAEYDRAIAQIAREDERSRRLMRLPGIGPNTATALLASVITSAGIAAGIDMSLHLVSRLSSDTLAKATARQLDVPYRCAA